MVQYIETDTISATLRAKAIDVPGRRLLVTDFRGSLQAQDLTEPPNCDGIGRIHRFRRLTGDTWPENPLPIEPATRALKLRDATDLRVQVFQNAVCNWRCWYCFVDFALLAANPRHAAMVSVTELVDRYLAEPDRAPVIDLTGGQPDLVPEWVPWMMRELRARGLEQSVYLWSDDNLSNDYFWRFLDDDDEDRELIAAYPSYGKVGCFKGYNASSFAFNTRAHPALFDRQFELMGRLLSLGLDQYAYVTLTSPSVENIREDMARFFERLQLLDERLPLRTVPLKIQQFTPTQSRRLPKLEETMMNQEIAIEAWQNELEQRFSSEDRARNVTEVPLLHRTRRS